MVKVGLKVGSTNCDLLGKYCTDTVFAPAGMEAPVNEYSPQPENSSVSATISIDILVCIFKLNLLKAVFPGNILKAVNFFCMLFV